MKKTYHVLFSIFILAALIVAPTILAQPTGTPGSASGSGVNPIFEEGNPKCADLEYCECASSFKPQPEPPSSGSYTNPDDQDMTVKIESDGTYFSWSSTQPVCCVIVKGGPNANVYVYDPKSTADTELHPPVNPKNGKIYEISHIEFCYAPKEDEEYKLEIIKTAETSYTREYKWTLDKTVSPEYAKICEEDEEVRAKYKVTVDKTGYEDSHWMVTGVIKIYNPNRYTAVIENIVDIVDGGIHADLHGISFPYKLDGGQTLEVPYSAELPDGSDRLNNVKVTTSGKVQGGTASADVIFGDPTTVLNDKIHVDDTNGMSWKFADDASVKYEKVFTTIGEFENTVTIRETLQRETVTATAKIVIVLQDPPEADFSAEPRYGIAPMEVHFTNLSRDADEWLWDFGDGHTSTEKHPTHVYTGNRKHISVTLTVWNCAGEDVAYKENYITVNRPSEVNFEASPLAGLPGLEVNFVNNVGGNANHHLWNYGDGTSEEFNHDYKNRVHPTHVYENPGEYHVSLKSWGNGGEDELLLPGLVYVDEEFDYLNLQLVSAGATYAGEGWENVIDHDIYGPGSNIAAAANDAWAVFMFADSAKYDIYKLRLLVDTIEPGNMVTNLTKDIEVWVSDDGENFEEGFKAVSTKKDGVWELFELEEPVFARYLKVVLTSARGEFAAYRNLVEMQFFGEKNAAELALNKPSSNSFAADAVPTSYKLAQNYPNPFNPETYITYELPENAHVKLEIYNIQGKLIQTLVNGQMSAGTHQVLWDGHRGGNGNSVGSGIYIYRLQAIGENGKAVSFTRKMTLMK